MKRLLITSIILFSTCLLYGQDLIIESVTTNSSFYQHDQFTADITIKNIGILSTESTYSAIYLTDDISENQTYVGDVSIPALGADESYTFTESGYPLNLDVGSYTVVARIPTNHDWEVNKENNRYVGSEVELLASTADLSISNTIPLSYSISKGGLLEIDIEAINSGSPISHTNISAYLSDDEILDIEDIKLPNQDDYLPFSYTNNSAERLSYAIPYHQTLGEYNIILIIDAYNRINEVNENNNEAIISNVSVVDSDIQLEINYGFASISEYDIFLNFDIRNSGNTSSAIQKVEVYSSSDGMNKEFGFGDFVYTNETIEINETGFFYESLFLFDENIQFIIIENSDPNYPLIEPYVITVDGFVPPNYNFEINSFQFEPQPETSDEAFDLALEIHNPNDNSIYEYAEFIVNLTSLDGSVSESFTIQEYLTLYNYSTETIHLSFDNRPSLLAGEYNVVINASIPGEVTNISPSSGTVEIIQSDITISLDINGNDGEVIDKGVVYLYEKIGEDIVYQSNQEITLNNGIGNVTFQKVNGNYMFYAVPDIDDYPDYIPTVSGNTFTLEASSFQLIEADTNLDIDLIYVDPTPLNGNKLIEGNIINGTTSNVMSLVNVASIGFSETAVYLISEDVIIAKTLTDTNGAFSFQNVPEGNFDVYFDDGNIIEDNDVNVPVNLSAEDDILILDINSSGEVQSTPLDMDFTLLSLSSEELNINSESLNLELQIQGNANNDIDALPVNFLIYVEQNGSEIESFNISEEINLSQGTQQILTFNPNLGQRLSPGDYQLTITYSSEFKLAGLEEVSTDATIFNNTFSFEELSIINELNTESEVIDIALGFIGNTDNDIVDLNTTFNISILSGAEVIFEQDLVENLNIASGSVSTVELLASLGNTLDAGDYTLIVSYSNKFMETPYIIDGLAFEVRPVINNSITFQEISIINELNTDSEVIEITLEFGGNADNDIVDLNSTFNISILSGAEVIFEQDLVENLNIASGSVSTVELLASLGNTFEAGDYTLIVSYSNEFMEAPYIIDGLAFEVSPVINNSITFQELSIANELNTDSDVIEITMDFAGNTDNDIVDLNTTFNISIFSGTEVIFEEVLIQNLNIPKGTVERIELSVILNNTFEAGDYILVISYFNEFMEVPRDIDGLAFEVKDIITSNRTNKSNDITVFPNPTNGFISIKGDFNYIELLDLNGKKVLTTDFNSNSGQMNLGDLNNGLYLLKVKKDSSYKFIKVVKK